MLTQLISKLPPNLRDNIRGLKRFSIFNKKKPKKQLLIYFADGRFFHGGLTDRLKGIISLFAFCHLNSLEFRILHTSPFELNQMLLPNIYNWSLRNDDTLTFNLFESKYLFLIGEPLANRLIKLNSTKQIHCYANRDILSELQDSNTNISTWGYYFHLLFKPGAKLNARIKYFQSIIGGDYISLVFRFQNLLGDFEEYNKPQLAEDKKKQLIETCKSEIRKIQIQENQRILVTSDSQSFLKCIKNMAKEEIFSFPEKVVHLDNIVNESVEVYMKSFVDFYLLAESTKIYSIGSKEMYKTEFPEYAAKVNDIEFQRIIFD